ncbi:MAG: thioesterase family protein [Desulfopila sp.]
MKETMDLKDTLVLLKDIYENSMPFNRLLEIHIDRLTPTDVQVSVEMREELIGNFIRGILHGGVISSILDLTGGLIASVELLKQLDNVSREEIARRLTRIGTIDLRVDYLRAGKGGSFLATGTILRQGNRVAVVRTELHNERNLLIAAGTGTYQVG